MHTFRQQLRYDRSHSAPQCCLVALPVLTVPSCVSVGIVQGRRTACCLDEPSKMSPCISRVVRWPPLAEGSSRSCDWMSRASSTRPTRRKRPHVLHPRGISSLFCSDMRIELSWIYPLCSWRLQGTSARQDGRIEALCLAPPCTASEMPWPWHGGEGARDRLGRVPGERRSGWPPVVVQLGVHRFPGTLRRRTQTPALTSRRHFVESAC